MMGLDSVAAKEDPWVLLVHLEKRDKRDHKENKVHVEPKENLDHLTFCCC
jgi:hypothetical protein